MIDEFSHSIFFFLFIFVIFLKMFFVTKKHIWKI